MTSTARPPQQVDQTRGDEDADEQQVFVDQGIEEKFRAAAADWVDLIQAPPFSKHGHRRSQRFGTFL
jgi:hypothetical protein